MDSQHMQDLHCTLQLLRGIIKQCEELGADLRRLWISPAEVQLSSQLIAKGGTSMVYHGTLRGAPVAVKVYHISCPQSPGEAPSMDQLLTSTLVRELCIIDRARQFHHVCR